MTVKDNKSVKGIGSIRTMSNTGKRNIPGCMTPNYLNLFLLDKEKDRKIMERNRLSIKMDIVNNRLVEVEAEINRLRKIEGLAETTTHTKALEKAKEEYKAWKTISLKY